MRAARLLAVFAVVAALLGAVGPVGIARAQTEPEPTTPIRHFVFLMQGGRTFDNYFGTFPGADGLPPGACQPRSTDDPSQGCVRPFALHGTTPTPLSPTRSIIAAQLDRGRMNGFVSAYTAQGRDGSTAMGHYDDRDLPFSWAAARHGVLFDRFFSAVPYGIAAERSYWVSGAPVRGGDTVPPGGYGNRPTIFDRLQQAGISWKFYVEGYRPHETFRTPGSTQPIRAPLLGYARFVDDPALRGRIADLGQYYRDLDNGTLPSVAYIATNGSAERSARSLPAGQKLIRSLATQLAVSRYWDSSALLWSYDSSGGWYDHVRPPRAADGPRGLRVPAVLISPYARQGHIDHTVLDSTAALRFIEDNWRLKPLARRDATSASIVGAFDFGSGPRAPEVLPVQPPRRPVGQVDSAAVYGVYGTAAGAALLLVTVAAVRSTRSRRAVREGTNR
ncbi:MULTISPECIES: alkaline phosphatase family protein [unclassified Streptomyces]|uniref:alkaline phosphatase family protein n=1 Tax=unclassified Streptomyces TaxID=2593676 RepID=UPI00236729F7|nr:MULTISPECIES: alkaline phosphatase family protein [unclassified Streptomyces]MDF3143071.1 alkaline phosphatase family protein [Streptomyces sp. T21Q-yed]WDF43028.1 alkaline phosphatase family protein [Streptomyces sp. T12]